MRSFGRSCLESVLSFEKVPEPSFVELNGLKREKGSLRKKPNKRIENSTNSSMWIGI
jgi:hypothetical protein